MKKTLLSTLFATLLMLGANINNAHSGPQCTGNSCRSTLLRVLSGRNGAKVKIRNQGEKTIRVKVSISYGWLCSAYKYVIVWPGETRTSFLGNGTKGICLPYESNFSSKHSTLIPSSLMNSPHNNNHRSATMCSGSRNFTTRVFRVRNSSFRGRKFVHKFLRSCRVTISTSNKKGHLVTRYTSTLSRGDRLTLRIGYIKKGILRPKWVYQSQGFYKITCH